MRMAAWLSIFCFGVAISCSAPTSENQEDQPANRVVRTPPPAAGSPNHAQVDVDPKQPCIDNPGHVDNCRVGVRGTAAEQCFELVGYLADNTPGGREVHAEPDARSRILGRIREPVKAAGRTWEVGFDIKGSRDGWLLVEGAADDPVLTEGVNRRMYGGAGWIRGEGVSASVQASQAFAAPDFSSEIVMQPVDRLRALTDHGDLAGIRACDGSWVLGRWKIREQQGLRYSPRAVISRNPLVIGAWVTGICDIQETSCDSLSGDRPGAR